MTCSDRHETSLSELLLPFSLTVGENIRLLVANVLQRYQVSTRNREAPQSPENHLLFLERNVLDYCYRTDEMKGLRGHVVLDRRAHERDPGITLTVISYEVFLNVDSHRSIAV